MKSIRKSVLIILMVLILFPVLVLGEGIFPIPDSLYDYYGAGGVETTVSMNLKAFAPYAADTVEQINQVLSYLQVDLAVSPQNERMDFSFSVDDVLIASFQQKNGGFTTSLLPKRTFVGDLEQLFLKETDQSEPFFDLFQAIKETESCYQSAKEAIMASAVGKKANYNIKGVGGGKWSYVAKLNKAQAEEMAPLLLPVLACGLPEEERAVILGLTLKNGFTAALYQTASDGDDIALYAKGNVQTADGANRALSYQWAFSNQDGKRVDTYKLELGKGKNGGFSVSASITQKQSNAAYQLKGNMEMQRYHKEGSSLNNIVYNISGEEKGNQRTLIGDVVVSENDQSTAYTVNMVLEDVILNGQISVAQRNGKKVSSQTDFELRNLARMTKSSESKDTDTAGNSIEISIVTDQPENESGEKTQVNLFASDSSLSQNETDAAEDYQVGSAPETLLEISTPEDEQMISLKNLTPEEIELLRREAAQRLAGRLVIALGKLSDIKLIQDGLSQENQQLLLQMIAGLS